MAVVEPLVLVHPYHVVVVTCDSIAADKLMRDFRRVSPFPGDVQVTPPLLHPSNAAESVFVTLVRTSPHRVEAFALASILKALGDADVAMSWWQHETQGATVRAFRRGWEMDRTLSEAACPYLDSDGDDDDDDSEGDTLTAPHRLTSSASSFGQRADELQD